MKKILMLCKDLFKSFVLLFCGYAFVFLICFILFKIGLEFGLLFTVCLILTAIVTFWGSSLILNEIVNLYHNCKSGVEKGD